MRDGYLRLRRVSGASIAWCLQIDVRVVLQQALRGHAALPGWLAQSTLKNLGSKFGAGHVSGGGKASSPAESSGLVARHSFADTNQALSTALHMPPLLPRTWSHEATRASRTAAGSASNASTALEHGKLPKHVQRPWRVRKRKQGCGFVAAAFCPPPTLRKPGTWRASSPTACVNAPHWARGALPVLGARRTTDAPASSRQRGFRCYEPGGLVPTALRGCARTEFRLQASRPIGKAFLERTLVECTC